MVFKSLFACIITLFHTKHKSVKQILLFILILHVREGGDAERVKNLLKVIKMINSGSLNPSLLYSFH